MIMCRAQYRTVSYFLPGPHASPVRTHKPMLYLRVRILYLHTTVRYMWQSNFIYLFIKNNKKTRTFVDLLFGCVLLVYLNVIIQSVLLSLREVCNLRCPDSAQIPTNMVSIHHGHNSTAQSTALHHIKDFIAPLGYATNLALPILKRTHLTQCQHVITLVCCCCSCCCCCCCFYF